MRYCLYVVLLVCIMPSFGLPITVNPFVGSEIGSSRLDKSKPLPFSALAAVCIASSACMLKSRSLEVLRLLFRK